jgi:hypothetical protein
MDSNFKIVTENNIERFLERLYVEKDRTRRDLYQTLLIGEAKRYGTLKERRDTLQRLLRTCDWKLVRQRALISYQTARGADPREAQNMLDRVLKVQSILRAELRLALHE